MLGVFESSNPILFLAFAENEDKKAHLQEVSFFVKYDTFGKSFTFSISNKEGEVH